MNKKLVSGGITYYAIGDVHGMAWQLDKLLFDIAQDAQTKAAETNRALVMLGDYVDRGPDSKSVIDRIIALQNATAALKSPFFHKVIALRGNHEQMMLDAAMLGDRTSVHHWIINGGEQTLQSYNARYPGDLPNEHLEWIAELPYSHVDHLNKLIFIHAGFYPAAWPNVSNEEAMWTRNAEFLNSDNDQNAKLAGWDNPELKGYLVLHGHTPENYRDGMLPRADSRRINLDTGACFGGMLSCAIVRPGRKIEYLQVSGGIIKP